MPKTSPICLAVLVELRLVTNTDRHRPLAPSTIKTVDEFVRMHKITRSVKVALKCLIAVVFVEVGIPYWTSTLSIQSHLRPFSATFVMRMRRNGYLWTSGVNLDTTIRFTDRDFLLECNISATWRSLQLIFTFYMLNVRHISTSGVFDLLT